MIFEIPKEDILEGLIRQLKSFFSVSNDEIEGIKSLGDSVFERCKICFSKNTNKYYSKDGEAYFNPYHSGQYTVFLYYFSNTVFKTGRHIRLADKIYYLNKIMNSCDLFYEVELPEIFMLDQPVGTVLGRATYGNYFKFTQNCTVGSNKNIYPVLGEYVTMTTNSKVFGSSKIGNNVTIGVGACVKDEDIPDESLVFGSSPNLIIKKKEAEPVLNIDLTSERLVLKRLSANHISTDYVSWLNDPGVNVFLETKGNYTIEMLEKYVEEQYKNEIYFWAIHLKDTNKHIGNIKIDPINDKENSGEYGILMGDRTNWGKGYAKEASLRIITYCFEELKLSKITLGVIQDNINAVKLYEKIGFTIDEVKKDVGIYNNKLSNSLRMSLNAKNFK